MPSIAPPTPALRRRSCILGTAGHIDHGKSSLVLALTGTNPDRLPEEQRRGMTIELGFARLTLGLEHGLAAPVQVGIVDVPGHEKFVKTMVSGATGIDLGMLVVAADDGVMPQTREHVDILDLLGIRLGLIVISKADLTDTTRIEQVRAQIADLVRNTGLRGWPIVSASARQGAGLDAVRRTIADLFAQLPATADGAVFRLAIDRVFSVHGRGTVVTGSVLSGKAAVGTTLELQPAGRTCKVRELQSFGDTLNDVAAGQRAALNLTGVEKEQIERGMELGTPGYLTPTRYVDTRVRVLARRDRPLPSFCKVRISIGAMEVMATLVVIGADRIDPGVEAWVQLRTHAPILASYGQRFILRDETAQDTIGGGRVVRPVSRRIRPKAAEELDSIRRADDADPFVRVGESLRAAGLETLTPMRIACQTGIEPADVPPLIARLRSSGVLVTLPGGREVHRTAVDALEQRTLAYLTRYHATHAQEPGILRDRLTGWIEQRSAAGSGKVLLDRLLAAKRVLLSGPYIAHADFRPALSPEDAALLDRLIAEIAAGAFDPPAWSALKTVAALSKQRAKLLEDLAKCEPRLVGYGPGQYISREHFDKLKATVIDLARSGPFKLAQVRDALNLNRRAVQPLLEHLDRVHFTKRVGDERVLMEGKA